MSYDDPVSADEVVRSIAAGAREGMAQVMQLGANALRAPEDSESVADGPDEADVSEHYWVSTYIPPAQPPCINGNYHAWGCDADPGSAKGLGGSLILVEFTCPVCGLIERGGETGGR